jgi:hypothetical protein
MQETNVHWQTEPVSTKKVQTLPLKKDNQTGFSRKPLLTPFGVGAFSFWDPAIVSLCFVQIGRNTLQFVAVSSSKTLSQHYLSIALLGRVDKSYSCHFWSSRRLKWFNLELLRAV